MDNYNVIKAKKEKNRVITHDIDIGEGKVKKFKYSSVKGGISWSIGSTPHYYCIWGEEWLDIDHSDKKKQRGKLRLFAEHESPALSLEDFFRKLTDDTTLFHCESLYTNRGDEYSEFVEAYCDFKYKEKIKIGSLEQAPLADNFSLGLARIKEWMRMKALEIPEDSLVYPQLKNVVAPNLEESPEKRFYAINGLRFVIAAFQKYPESHYVFKPPRRTPHGPNAWMG